MHVTIYCDPRHGTYYASYYLRGRRVRRSMKTKNRDVAMRLAARIEDNLELGRLSYYAPLTLEKAIGLFLESRADFSPTTRLWYTGKLDVFRVFVGDNPQVRHITGQRLRKFRVWRQRERSPGTVKGDMVAVGALFSWLVSNGYLKASPATPEIKRVPRASEQLRRALTKAERAQLLTMLEGSPLRPVALFGLYAGLRRAELCSLERADVRDGIIELRNKPELGFTLKNYRVRFIPLEPELVEAVEGLPLTGPAFPTPTGLHWQARNLGRLWKDTFAALNALRVQSGQPPAPYFTMHELRHSYASIQIQERGADIYTVMRRMGHSNITTTERYFHQFKP